MSQHLALILVWSLLGLMDVMASPWAGAGDAFGRLELWLYAVLAGLLFRAPGTWLGFWTINHTGVQTYLGLGMELTDYLMLQRYPL